MNREQPCPRETAPMMSRLVDTLYTDALLIADEARGYFDGKGAQDREMLDPAMRVGFSCEALKVTTRLMHVVAWLLNRRAVVAGELSAAEALQPSCRLAALPVSAREVVARLPDQARWLTQASIALHRRAAMHDSALAEEEAAASPARSLQAMIAATLA